MNIKHALLEDKAQSRAKAILVAEYACTSKANFKQLMQCFLANNYRLSQRAAWAVCWAAKRNSLMIEPYLPQLVAQLTNSQVHAAVIRNSVRVLEDMTIPENLHGDLMNACFALVEAHDTPAAIKAFALTNLYNLTKFYPEICRELRLIIEERFENETPAFRSRGKKILKQLPTV
jgi:hypothetical protein